MDNVQITMADVQEAMDDDDRIRITLINYALQRVLNETTRLLNKAMTPEGKAIIDNIVETHEVKNNGHLEEVIPDDASVDKQPS